MPKGYKLPLSLRPSLAKPLGRLFSPEALRGSEYRRLLAEARMVVTVGDRVTETLARLGRPPEVQVIDGRENRKRRKVPDVPYATLVRVSNPAGTLTDEAIAGIRAAFGGEKPVRVLVAGEEDLVAILAIAMAPPSSVVFYGQPGLGLVAVKVDSRSKARNRKILAEMGIKETL